jgi:hypothetical protein
MPELVVAMTAVAEQNGGSACGYQAKDFASLGVALPNEPYDRSDNLHNHAEPTFMRNDLIAAGRAS